jgi:hypothetical protein
VLGRFQGDSRFGPMALKRISNDFTKSYPIQIQIKFNFRTVPIHNIKYKSIHESKIKYAEA